MFSALLLLLSLLGYNVGTYEDCTITIGELNQTPMNIAVASLVQDYNALPDDVRFETCRDWDHNA